MSVQVHYRPTGEGAELMAALQSLVDWGLRHCGTRAGGASTVITSPGYQEAGSTSASQVSGGATRTSEKPHFMSCR
jgi:hypothetical protein